MIEVSIWILLLSNGSVLYILLYGYFVFPFTPQFNFNVHLMFQFQKCSKINQHNVYFIQQRLSFIFFWLHCLAQNLGFLYSHEKIPTYIILTCMHCLFISKFTMMFWKILVSLHHDDIYNNKKINIFWKIIKKNIF